jgi:hypothetical protein
MIASVMQYTQVFIQIFLIVHQEIFMEFVYQVK